MLQTRLTEFMGEEREEREWDTRGLSSWAMSQFQVNLPQNQIRRMTPEEVEEQLKAAAIEHIDKRDCAALTRYLEPLYAENQLANWAHEKFGVRIDPKNMILDATRNIRKPPEEIAALIEKEGRAAYTRREIEYPVDHVLTVVFGEDGATDNAYAADYIRAWAMGKYRRDIPLDEIRGVPVRRLRDRLIGLQEQFLGDGLVDEEVDKLIEANSDPTALVKAFQERFQTRLKVADLEDIRNPRPRYDAKGKPLPPEENELSALSPDQRVRGHLVRSARNFLRGELTQLEQFVLIQILDQSWKDHLYAMDMLRTGIGLQAFAERDPRIAYKKEGYRYFQEMMEEIRAKVTDLIFRIRISGRMESRSAYNVTAATHEEGGGYGVGENVAAANKILGEKTASQQADEAQQSAIKVKQIVRETPKIGRNDPCPCGSGKKYKKCCGKDAA